MPDSWASTPVCPYLFTITQRADLVGLIGFVCVGARGHVTPPSQGSLDPVSIASYQDIAETLHRKSSRLK
ncbi:hypothetical protein L6R29_03760 [Myxococcota bacterium]|nr:hypothetical protein [Myxococcota bacterium]